MRALVALLVLLNAALLAWNLGWLQGPLGLHPHGDREPERLTLQVRPDSVRVLPAGAASAPSGAAAGDGSSVPDGVSEPASTAATASANAAGEAALPIVATSAQAGMQCLQAGPFNADSVAAAEQMLTRLPAGSWRRVTAAPSGGFLVYVGKFADRESLRRQMEELQQLQISVEEARNAPALEPGLVLGRFDSRDLAEAALTDLLSRGARAARIVAQGNGTVSFMLRVDRADAALASQVTALRGNALGAGFAACGAAR